MIYIIPAVMTATILFALKKRTPVYSEFCEGAAWGMRTVASIFPVILAIGVAVAMMRSSGLLDFLISAASPITSRLGIPSEILPLAMIRPISGGGSIGVLTDILKQYHPDSFIGLCACTIMGSTETTFYTLMVYFKNTRVKHNAIVIPAAVFGDIVGLIVGVWVCSIFF